MIIKTFTFLELFDYVCKKAVVEYGRIFRFWVINEPQVVIANAKDAEKILQGMQHHVKSKNYRFLDSWMGEGLLTSKGWQNTIRHWKYSTI